MPCRGPPNFSHIAYYMYDLCPLSDPDVGLSVLVCDLLQLHLLRLLCGHFHTARSYHVYTCTCVHVLMCSRTYRQVYHKRRLNNEKYIRTLHKPIASRSLTSQFRYSEDTSPYCSAPSLMPSYLLITHAFCFQLLSCTFLDSHQLLTLKALPRQWVALETAILQSLRSRMLTSVGPFFFISLLIVSMYLNVGFPLGLTPSTSMSSTVLVIWLSSLRLTCPYQRSRFCIRCVAIG